MYIHLYTIHDQSLLYLQQSLLSFPLPFTPSLLRKIQLYSYAVINGICEGCHPRPKKKVYAEQERISGGGIGLLSISLLPRGEGKKLKRNNWPQIQSAVLNNFPFAALPLPRPSPPPSLPSHPPLSMTFCGIECRQITELPAKPKNQQCPLLSLNCQPHFTLPFCPPLCLSLPPVSASLGIAIPQFDRLQVRLINIWRHCLPDL